MVHQSEQDLDRIGSENSSQVLSILRDSLDGFSASDGRLPTERDLAVQFDVGRREVRRALEVLEAEGLIWRKQGKGTFLGSEPRMTNSTVNSLLKQTSPVELCEARALLEPRLAGMAAARATHEQIQRMRELCDRIDNAGDDDARELWDEALHRMIGQAADNTLLFGLCEIFEEVHRDDVWRSLRERARSETLVALYSQQHSAIVAAISARDEKAAEMEMLAHIDTLTENILKQDLMEVTRAG